MAFISVVVGDVIVSTATTVIVNFRWSAIDSSGSASDNGSEEFGISLTSALLNSAIIDLCVSRAATAGVTIGILDRKLITSSVAG